MTYVIYKDNYDRLNMIGRERANRTLIGYAHVHVSFNVAHFCALTTVTALNATCETKISNLMSQYRILFFNAGLSDTVLVNSEYTRVVYNETFT